MAHPRPECSPAENQVQGLRERVEVLGQFSVKSLASYVMIEDKNAAGRTGVNLPLQTCVGHVPLKLDTTTSGWENLRDR